MTLGFNAKAQRREGAKGWNRYLWRRCAIAVFLCAALFLAFGCGLGNEPLPTPTPVPTATATLLPPTPSSKPEPTPTETPPTLTPAPPLSPTGTPMRATATPVPIPSAPPIPTATPDTRRRGGTLNLATPNGISHLDVHADVSPALSTWGPGIAYSRLLRLRSGADVELPSLAVECDLCARWEMESPTTYRFGLRPDARWQNVAPAFGRLADANDVVFSYERQSDPELPNSPLLANVGEVRALDRSTLLITLDKPDADALLAFADGHSKIVAREAVELSGDLRDGPTVGSGPWVYDPGGGRDVHSFERNPDYYETGLPLADNLRIHAGADDKTQAAAFQIGLMDVVSMQPDTWRDYSERSPSAPFLAAPQPGAGVEVAFKTTEPPFDNLELRRAAMLAMEPLKAIEEHWDGFGYIGPSFPAASAEWLLPREELAQRFGRRNDAVEVAAKSGAPFPVPLAITVGDFGESYVHHAHAISVELSAIGFDSELEVVNRRDFGERVWLGGDYRLMVGPPAPIVAPNGYLLTTLHSLGIWNTTGHKDDVLDDLIERQAVEFDPAARAELIRAIQRRVLDQAYRFMPASAETVWTWRAPVRDFHPNFGAYEYHHWARVWVEG